MIYYSYLYLNTILGNEIFNKDSKNEQELSIIFLKKLLQNFEGWNDLLGYDIKGKETKFHKLHNKMEIAKQSQFENDDSLMQEDLLIYYDKLLRVRVSFSNLSSRMKKSSDMNLRIV